MNNDKHNLLKGKENQITWQIQQTPSALILTITAHYSERPILHWGVAWKKWDDWNTPPVVIHPPGTKEVKDGKAAQTPMIETAEDNQYHITITIPNDLNIKQLYFVLYFPHNHQWENNHGRDYIITLLSPELFTLILQQKHPEIQSLLYLIFNQENRKSWEMGMRLEFIQQMLTQFQINESILSLLDIYLQYASQGHLPWRRYYDRQTYILAPKIEGTALKISKMLTNYPKFLSFWRQMLKSLPSSGRNLKDIGMAIRLKILECKDHQNWIIYDQFVSEFHQKLHNASGPEDIAITGAYLAFLDSNGDVNKFLKKLLEAGLAKKEKKNGSEVIISLLDQYGDYRSIHHLPSYHAEKAPPARRVFQELLNLLEGFFGGVGLEEAIQRTRPIIDSSLQHKLDNFLYQKNEIAAVFSTSKGLVLLENIHSLLSIVHKQLLTGHNSILLLHLDLVLEDYAKAQTNTLLNALLTPNQPPRVSDDQLFLLKILLDYLLLNTSSDQELPSIQQELEEWTKRGDHNNDWCLQGKAILDHLQRITQQQTHTWMSLYQPKAETLGRLLEIEPQAWQNFGEEHLRNSWLFLISRLITFMQKTFRQIAGWSTTEILVTGAVKGIILKLKEISSISTFQTQKPIIALLEHLQGDEDIPQAIVGIISKVSRDRMSHFGIRAREQGVVWVYLEDETDYQKITKYEGQQVKIVATEDRFEYSPIQEPSLMTTKEEKREEITIPKVRLTDSFTVLTPNQYELLTVGPKAHNLRLLQERITNHALIPDSIAIPFGTFELILKDNPGIMKKYQRLVATQKQEDEQMRRQEVDIMAMKESKGLIDTFKKKEGSILSERLKALRSFIESIPIPEDFLLFLKKSIQKRLGDVPLITRSSSNAEDIEGYSGAGLYESFYGVTLDNLSSFLKKVWASKWTERATSNRLASNIDHEDVYLSVIIQQLISTDYAFVVHTCNPINWDRNQIYIELVQGLGESLVSGTEGHGYSFIYDKSLEKANRVGYANKGYRLLVEADGAIKKTVTNYSQDIWAKEETRWEPLIRQIAEVSMVIETAWNNQPQDIEGAIKAGQIFIVQARPQ
ncbi:MAG: PEP/pyruvate-binding domain-containing protein [bacterium]